jgi:hypothetical protein
MSQRRMLVPSGGRRDVNIVWKSATFNFHIFVFFKETSEPEINILNESKTWPKLKSYSIKMIQEWNFRDFNGSLSKRVI